MHINNTHICLNKHMKWKGDKLYNEQWVNISLFIY
jgi:hypothetical protein